MSMKNIKNAKQVKGKAAKFSSIQEAPVKQTKWQGDVKTSVKKDQSGQRIV